MGIVGTLSGIILGRVLSSWGNLIVTFSNLELNWHGKYNPVDMEYGAVNSRDDIERINLNVIMYLYNKKDFPTYFLDPTAELHNTKKKIRKILCIDGDTIKGGRGGYLGNIEVPPHAVIKKKLQFHLGKESFTNLHNETVKIYIKYFDEKRKAKKVKISIDSKMYKDIPFC